MSQIKEHEISTGVSHASFASQAQKIYETKVAPFLKTDEKSDSENGLTDAQKAFSNCKNPY